MAILLTNATLVDINPLRVESGCLRLDKGKITSRGTSLSPESGDEIIDCRGAVVIPGMVNGHTHLYSALAVGMPAPKDAPKNFLEILERVWWRLDQALNHEATETSARVGALAALRCGTTTLIDHHASPSAIKYSLDHIEEGISAVGLRGVLCYETTDRHGIDGRNAGIDENRRYLLQCRARESHQFAGMVGAHASFTLEDDALSMLAELARGNESGVHIHVAEDHCDESDARQRGSESLIERLARTGILDGRAILAHCTHLDAPARSRIASKPVTVAHNARSNMNNAVGYAQPATIENPVMLGTDGIGGDMFAEAKAAWFVSRHAGGGLSPNDVIAMLANAADRAGQALGVTLGQLAEGSAADIVITDYHPTTPLNSENLAGHLLFGLDARCVRDVIIDGKWALRDRAPAHVDASEVAREAQPIATKLWQRMDDIA